MFLLYILALALGYFKFSLEECIEFTIFISRTIVVRGLSSSHNFEKILTALKAIFATETAKQTHSNHSHVSQEGAMGMHI